MKGTFAYRLVSLRLWCLAMVLGVISLTHAQDSIRVIDEVTVKGRLLHHETIEPQTLRASDIQKVRWSCIIGIVITLGWMGYTFIRSK